MNIQETNLKERRLKQMIHFLFAVVAHAFEKCDESQEDELLCGRENLLIHCQESNKCNWIHT